jgi:hypothetical protein
MLALEHPGAPDLGTVENLACGHAVAGSGATDICNSLKSLDLVSR